MMLLFHHSTLLLLFLATSSKADLCIKGAFTLTLEKECSVETLKDAYEELYNNEVLRDNDCSNTIEEDLAEILGTADLDAGVQALCAGADLGNTIPLETISHPNPDDLFTKTYFDGGTYWNEEVQTELETGDKTNVLNDDAAKVYRFYESGGSHGVVEWPNHLSNFELDTCNINAAMCCWPQDRQAGDGNGNCNQRYDQRCIDKDPADNTDLCLVNMNRAPGSVPVGSDGIIIHENDDDDGEGAIHCHGFAWSNDAGHASNRYKANNLFYVSMYDHMLQRGYVRNIHGAPMCACLEQMPVVTRSDCTQIDVEETFEISVDGKGKASAKLTTTDIEFNSCQGKNNNNNDLEAYVARLVDEGHITKKQQESLEGIIVGDDNCPRAQERYLAAAGIVRGISTDKYELVYEFPEVMTEEFVHGLCVAGASQAAASSSYDELTYDAVSGFEAGQRAWGDRDYTYRGVKDTVCADGIFLKPSKHKEIDRFTSITIGATPSSGASVTICAIVEDDGRGGNPRDGGWLDELAEGYRFSILSGEESGLSWRLSSRKNVPMALLCKELPEMPTVSPTPRPTGPPVTISGLPEETFTFPATATKRFVHGISVLGASSVKASVVTRKKVHYTATSFGTDPIKAWNNRNYRIEGQDTTPYTTGATFLRPSKHKKIDSGTVIEVEMVREGKDKMVLCAFVEPGERSGNWPESLVELGWTDYGTSYEEFYWRESQNKEHTWHLLCRDF
jgi:hypothetical protein